MQLTFLFVRQYVGDSETDLMCLLDADVGVIMNSPSMVDKCKKLGLHVQDNGRISDEKRQNESPAQKATLSHVKDFTAFL